MKLSKFIDEAVLTLAVVLICALAVGAIANTLGGN